MAVLPMAVFGLEVPAGDIAIPAKPDIPAAFRITMAAIDPSAEPEEGGPSEVSKPRATLKLIREPLLAGMDEDDSDFDEDEMNALLADEDDEDEDSEEEEDTNGGPSDPAKSKAARKQAAADQLRKELEDDMEVDKPNGVAKGKGKNKLLEALDVEEDEDEEDDDDDEDDDEFDEPEEFVICTLDPEKNYQQTLDITIGDDERVWFKVSGTHTIYLTGNYVEPADSHGHPYDDEDDYDSEDEDEYDLSPDEDELELDEDELSEDDLDDMEDPRVTELADDDEEAPKLVEAKKDKKGKNKRSAEEVDQSLDDLIAKAQPNGDKLSKKQAKKLKNNQGEAVAAEAKKEEPSSAKSDKKVQFAEKLETGPTPSPSATKKDDKAKAATGPRVVQGVTIDDKKIGDGRASKKGDRVGMRYIGKLKDGKVFDSNKKGKPFSFKLGSGEVIKGWDIGVVGMAVGGERRITVPANLAYGSRGAPPDIPPNSTLVFDIKMIEIK